MARRRPAAGPPPRQPQARAVLRLVLLGPPLGLSETLGPRHEPGRLPAGPFPLRVTGASPSNRDRLGRTTRPRGVHPFHGPAHQSQAAQAQDAEEAAEHVRLLPGVHDLAAGLSAGAAVPAGAGQGHRPEKRVRPDAHQDGPGGTDAHQAGEAEVPEPGGQHGGDGGQPQWAAGGGQDGRGQGFRGLRPLVKVVFLCVCVSVCILFLEDGVFVLLCVLLSFDFSVHPVSRDVTIAHGRIRGFIRTSIPGNVSIRFLNNWLLQCSALQLNLGTVVWVFAEIGSPLFTDLVILRIISYQIHRSL